MNCSMKSLVLLSLLLSCQLAYSQDAELAAKTESSEADVDGDKASVTPDIDLRGDAGMEAVRQVQKDPGLNFEPGKSAEETLQDFVQTKQWAEGWDEEKKRFFVVTSAKMDVDEPTTDRDFYVKREMLAKRSVLRAKAKIIEFINSSMSAVDKLEIPDTDVNTQFGAEYNAAEASLRAASLRVAKLLREYDEAEAAALEGASIKDRISALLDAAIKKLDKEYSSVQVETRKREQFEKAKARYASALKEMEETEAKVKSLQGQVQSTQSSEVQRLASMPLIGATVLAQTESWNEEDGQYQVAVLACWSVKLEQAARAALTGESVVDDYSGDESLSVQEWLAQQELGQMVGPRQFIDKNGQRWFIGVTARPVSKNAAVDEKNKELAAIFSSQIASFSLFSNVDTQAVAKQVMSVISSDSLERSETQATETLAQQMTQNFENLQIQGLGKIGGKIVTHELTGQKIHVAVYGISPGAAKATMELERQAALAAIQVHKSQSFAKKRSEALREGVEAAKNDPSSGKAGKLQGESELTPAKANGGKTAAAGTGDSKKPTEAGKTKSGSTKPGKVKDDF
ncbi:MAG: hypothetical protein MUC43_10755 [Pirellula sp.]|nr:hypothetical protein [Pirellula sp.]